MDKVVIKNILARGIIGIRDWERDLPQNILINIDIFTGVRAHDAPDNISECIDYSKLTKKVILHAETAKRFTVEALAEDIAQICLEDPRVLKQPSGWKNPERFDSQISVGVEIERTRE